MVCDCVLWHVPSKIKNGSKFRVSVRTHSVLGCTGSCGNTSSKKPKIIIKWLQRRCNYELILALTSYNICSYLRTMPILDDDVIIMCPSDLIGCDNRGTKRVRLNQLVLGEPVSH